MDSFVPPGYMTPAELIERTSRTRTADEWAGVVIVPSAEELALEAKALSEARRASVAKARAASSPRRWPDVQQIRQAAQRQAAQRAAQQAAQRADAIRHAVISVLRVPLLSAIITAVIKTSEGHLIEIPLHLWRGDRAVPALITGEATILYGHGLVLLNRAEAEAWLARAVGEAPTETTGSGMPGRPTSKPLILNELRRRIGKGEVCLKLAEEARALHGWLLREHRGVPRPPKPSTIENMIRDDHREAKKP